jgi:hypothetical protein
MQKWPIWSVSWYVFFIILGFFVITRLTDSLVGIEIIQEVLLYQILPLTIAILLYAVVRFDPLRGLLASIPITYALWQPNMEFVPDSIEIFIKIVSTILICLTITFLLRRTNWRIGLYAVMAMNLLVGILYSYAGIFHGGSLPFSASGPNIVETGRSMVPQYLATCAILIGPLFAWRLRRIGHSGGKAGLISYHVTLVGLLLVILTNLAAVMKGTNNIYTVPTMLTDNFLTMVIVLGMGMYLFGLIVLYRDPSS